MNRSILYIFAILAAFAVALYFGLAGVDFGPQWDQKNITGFVRHYVRTGTILPGEYHYPPVSSYIASTTLVPYVAPFIQRYGFNWIPTQRYLMEDVLQSNNKSFILNVRSTFVVFTMLGIVWTGLAAFQRDKLAGFVAAAGLAFSWEVSYQSRLVHPDGPTMQFVALSLLFCMLAYYERRPFKPRVWLGLAAVVAAAATATKYTAGVSLLMVLIFAFAILQRDKAYKLGKTVLWLSGLSVIFVSAFLLLVPGTLLETQIFIQQVVRDQEIYAAGHGYQTVNAGWDYLKAVFLFLFQAAFSYDRIIALFIPALAMLGIYFVAKGKDKHDLSLIVALAGVPMLYILFLITHRVSTAHNLLFIMPGLAILAGFGFSALLGRSKLVWRGVLITTLAVMIGINIGWLNYTVRTIRERGSNLIREEAIQRITNDPDSIVYVTPSAHKLLGDDLLPPNAVLEFNGTEDFVLFAYRADTRDEAEGSWWVNSPVASPEIFGPQEMNMDWYSNWPGTERLVLATVDIAWQDGAWLQRRTPPLETSAIELGSGNLSLDGEQFFVEFGGSSRVNILNSANPIMILTLRPLVDTEIVFSGVVDNVENPAASYLLEINGKQILLASDFAYEYNTSRLMLDLSEGQRVCIEDVLGPAQYENLAEATIGFIDLADEDLQRITICLD